VNGFVKRTDNKVNVAYQYELKYDLNVRFVSVLSALDTMTLNDLAGLLNCDEYFVDGNGSGETSSVSSGSGNGRRRRLRRLMSETSGIVGFEYESLAKSTSESCTVLEWTSGQGCVILTGNVTVYLTENANFNSTSPDLASSETLSIIKDSMLYGNYNDTNIGILQTYFKSSAADTNGNTFAAAESARTTTVQNTTLGIVGMSLIALAGAAFLVTLFLFLRTRRRRRRRDVVVRDYAVSDELSLDDGGENNASRNDGKRTIQGPNDAYTENDGRARSAPRSSSHSSSQRRQQHRSSNKHFGRTASRDGGIDASNNSDLIGLSLSLPVSDDKSTYSKKQELSGSLASDERLKSSGDGGGRGYDTDDTTEVSAHSGQKIEDHDITTANVLVGTPRQRDKFVKNRRTKQRSALVRVVGDESSSHHIASQSMLSTSSIMDDLLIVESSVRKSRNYSRGGGDLSGGGGSSDSSKKTNNIDPTFVEVVINQ